jgi:ABC-2 type transport system permease protein
MRAMILKEFRELRRDRRTLGMLVVMPIMLLVIFGYAANFNVTSIRTAVVGAQAEAVASQLPDVFDVTVISTTDTQADVEEMIKDNEVDVGIIADSMPALALVDGASSTSSATRSPSRCSTTPISTPPGSWCPRSSA